MAAPTLLFAGAVAGLVAARLGLALLRFRRGWKEFAAAYRDQPGLGRDGPSFPSTYCEVVRGERSTGSPGFVVGLSNRGVRLLPGLWHSGLPAAWLPWSAIAGLERAGRPVGRRLVAGVQLDLADAGGQVLIDDPAAQRLASFRPAGEAQVTGDAR